MYKKFKIDKVTRGQVGCKGDGYIYLSIEQKNVLCQVRMTEEEMKFFINETCNFVTGKVGAVSVLTNKGNIIDRYCSPDVGIVEKAVKGEVEVQIIHSLYSNILLMSCDNMQVAFPIYYEGKSNLRKTFERLQIDMIRNHIKFGEPKAKASSTGSKVVNLN